ncbi:hypothetical protein E9X60_004720 [Escherichia coli]|uniref:Uncharacterized protein n=1 Tax=Escherichia coli TaxID=562 RepID=A0A7T2J0U5_ECOLX|nr:hypothetical protein [Escherichia coli]EKD0898050.1 hypothetical protein [Shigella sonnei]EHP9672017.1 hypothetical protein [Escherichia coli]EHP9817022.1 hypothetical protein [Escherichia coli]EHP9981949.1 hypothetical protein [Escherichia coli]
MYYNRNRYYDPLKGKYMTQDPGKEHQKFTFCTK